MPRALVVPKLIDVARVAGVSNATASRALNGHTNVSDDARARILSVARELSYSPNRAAQSLKGGSSGMIGMVVPAITDDFFSSCAGVVESVAREQGALLVVLSAHDKSDLFVSGIRQLMLHNVDGIILGTSQYLSAELITELREIQVPVVGIDAPLTRAGLPSVLCHNFNGAYMATQHLLEHGYDCVVSLQVKPSLYTMRERLKGYKAAMRAAGQTPVHETICDRDTARQFLENYRDRAKPLAVVAGNNLTAQLLYSAARMLGYAIPQELAIISFDDFDLADTLTPPMSVVRQPVLEIGRAAAKLLFQQILGTPQNGILDGDGSRERLEISIEPRLVPRQSCGCHAVYQGSRTMRNRVE